MVPASASGSVATAGAPSAATAASSLVPTLSVGPVPCRTAPKSIARKTSIRPASAQDGHDTWLDGDHTHPSAVAPHTAYPVNASLPILRSSTWVTPDGIPPSHTPAYGRSGTSSLPAAFFPAALSAVVAPRPIIAATTSPLRPRPSPTSPTLPPCPPRPARRLFQSRRGGAGRRGLVEKPWCRLVGPAPFRHAQQRSAHHAVDLPAQPHVAVVGSACMPPAAAAAAAAAAGRSAPCFWHARGGAHRARRGRAHGRGDGCAGKDPPPPPSLSPSPLSPSYKKRRAIGARCRTVDEARAHTRSTSALMRPSGPALRWHPSMCGRGRLRDGRREVTSWAQGTGPKVRGGDGRPGPRPRPEKEEEVEQPAQRRSRDVMFDGPRTAVYRRSCPPPPRPAPAFGPSCGGGGGNMTCGGMRCRHPEPEPPLPLPHCLRSWPRKPAETCP